MREHFAPGPRILLLSVTAGTIHRHYQQVIVELQRAGADVTVGYDRDHEVARHAALGLPGKVWGGLHARESDTDSPVARLRLLADVLRYHHPDYGRESPLAERAHERATAGVRRWSRRLAHAPWGFIDMTARGALALANRLPPPAVARQILDDVRPDVLLACSLVRFPAPEADVVIEARRRGIPSIALTPSWDNLTNKGLMKVAADAVFVWNSAQREELVRYHRVAAASVVTTGAQTFDGWFPPPTSQDREEFCRDLGIDPGQPLIAFLGSSRSIAPREAIYFGRWLAALRSSPDPVLSGATVVVRPHPRNGEAWELRPPERLPGVAVSLPGEDGADGSLTPAYAALLRHAAVGVGVNTSAMLDAAMFGLPVCCPLDEGFRDGQAGTLHFRHVTGERHRSGAPGLVETAESLHEHLEQIRKHLERRPGDAHPPSEEFVRWFIRPNGIDTPVAPLIAAAVLDMRAPVGASAGAGPIAQRLARAVARPLSAMLDDLTVFQRLGVALAVRWMLARAAFRLVRRSIRRELRGRTRWWRARTKRRKKKVRARSLRPWVGSRRKR